MNKVYISGPIKLDPITALDRFKLAEDFITSKSDVPVNPFNCKPICVGHYPHNVYSQPEDHWNCYVRGDIVEMMNCNSIVMLDNWELSKGAITEFNLASALGFKIYLTLDEYEQLSI